MSPSLLSNSIRRTSDSLRIGASAQVADYEQRFSSLKNLYDGLIAGFIRTNFDRAKACRVAKQFFGTCSDVRFAGIDGTMYSRPLFDLVVFFGGAYASTGKISFFEESETRVTYDERVLQQSAGISSVVPVYVNDVPEIDHAFFGDGQSAEISPNRLLTDEAIINNATIANWIMTFAEYYLAYKLATDPVQPARIILLDRSLSIERASLIYDTAKRELWKVRSNLIGYEIDGEPVDVNDLTIARQCVCNNALGLPPPRADYLSYALIEVIRQKGSLSEEQVLTSLRLTDERRAKRAKRYLNRAMDEGILSKYDGTYSLNSKYSNTSERIRKLVTTMGDRFFFAETSENQPSSAMRIVKYGKECWLTTVDVAFLTLLTLHMLMQECWKRKTLLIGITKDTAARDFKRQLIPIMHAEGLIKPKFSRESFDRLPNTDRMILQSASMLNPDKVSPPWSLIEYDSAFRTMIPDRENRKGFVSGAIKNRMSLEKTFLKTYVQLAQAKSDPTLRSNVLLTDRLVYPDYDYRPENVLELCNEFGSALEPLEVILFRDNAYLNALQDLIMNILVAMAPSSIPDAFGHNKALFIADKIAKWNYSQFGRVVDTTADWIVNNHKLRRFVFYMSTFRERRATIEAARREQG